MASTPTALLTIEEYLSTTYHPGCDFVDGVLEERNWGELEHGLLRSEPGYWFRSHREEWRVKEWRVKEWRVKVVAESRTHVSATRIRIPDVCLIAPDAERETVRITPPFFALRFSRPRTGSPVHRW